MERVPVRSSNIASVGYDATARAMEVEFGNGGIYLYQEVPAELHERLMQSQSIGQFFHHAIRQHFRCVPVQPSRRA